MKHYKNDPRPITVRYSGECVQCNATIRRGQAAYYWPATGNLLCPKCGEAEYNSFLYSAFDEEVFNSMYPSSRF